MIHSVEDLTIKDEKFVGLLSQSQNKHIEIQVEDTGIGIKNEDKDKLFKLFGYLESSKEINTKGIGLGLYISKRLANIFDGEIICKSEFG